MVISSYWLLATSVVTYIDKNCTNANDNQITNILNMKKFYTQKYNWKDNILYDFLNINV